MLLPKFRIVKRPNMVCPQALQNLPVNADPQFAQVV